MKKIIAFTLRGCPYCYSAQEAYKKLQQKPEYKDVAIDWIDEEEHPDLATKYDHYYCPSLLVDGKKIYEAHPGDNDDYIYGMVENAMHEALA